MNPESKAIQIGYQQEMSDRIFAKHSAFSYGDLPISVESGYFLSFVRGRKIYELSNHLGNVLATVSDGRIAIDTNHNNYLDYYTADILSQQDYYPFGMLYLK